MILRNKSFENIKGKGENGGNYQFFFSHSKTFLSVLYHVSFVFCKSFALRLSFQVSNFRLVLPFTTQAQLLTSLKKKVLENTVEKGENAGNQHFLLFSYHSFFYSIKERNRH